MRLSSHFLVCKSLHIQKVDVSSFGHISVCVVRCCSEALKHHTLMQEFACIPISLMQSPTRTRAPHPLTSTRSSNNLVGGMRSSHGAIHPEYAPGPSDFSPHPQQHPAGDRSPGLRASRSMAGHQQLANSKPLHALVVSSDVFVRVLGLWSFSVKFFGEVLSREVLVDHDLQWRY